MKSDDFYIFVTVSILLLIGSMVFFILGLLKKVPAKTNLNSKEVEEAQSSKNNYYGISAFAFFISIPGLILLYKKDSVLAPQKI